MVEQDVRIKNEDPALKLTLAIYDIEQEYI